MARDLSVYGLSKEQLNQLRNLAKEKTGNASVSNLAKKLLLDLLPSSATLDSEVKTNRIEVRLTADTLALLKDLAQAEKMTTNAYITMIVQGYVNQNPVSTTAEVKALYQSNVQLVRIGNNLNQIAKALNLNQPTNITTELLNELKSTINKHTEKVGNIITANIERLK